MEMMGMLNDHDIGGPRGRDHKVIGDLRKARDVFRPWDPEVSFAGYWENDELVKSGSPDLPVSLYLRPDSLLLILGNTGKEAAEALITLDWNALKLDPRQLTVTDAETGDAIPASKLEKGFTLKVDRHDLRLALIAAPRRFAVEKKHNEMLKPKTILKEYSDDFTGPELSPVWKKDVHEGKAGVWMLNGQMCIRGNWLGYAQVRRELGLDNVSAQCQMMGTPGGLYLLWPNGSYVRAGVSMMYEGNVWKGKFTFAMTGIKDYVGGMTTPRWDSFGPNWVKMTLKPDMVEFYSSSDGKAWTKEWEQKRNDKFAGAPQYLILGYGPPGDKPQPGNMPKSFEPDQVAPTYYSDLIVGKE